MTRFSKQTIIFIRAPYLGSLLYRITHISLWHERDSVTTSYKDYTHEKDDIWHRDIITFFRIGFLTDRYLSDELEFVSKLLLIFWLTM